MKSNHTLDPETKLIGIDAIAFISKQQFPAMLYHYNLRHLKSLIQLSNKSQEFTDNKGLAFLFFCSDSKAQEEVFSIFRSDNTILGMAGSENQSKLSLYYMPDQLSLLPSRPPPLLFAPRYIPISLLVHNVLAISALDKFLRRWPPEIGIFQMHALEMITASPAIILSPSKIEKDIARSISQLPERQFCSLEGGAAIPNDFICDDQRWLSLKQRLQLPEHFLLAPSDTLSQLAEDYLQIIFEQVKKSFPDAVLVRPALRKYVAALLPEPSKPDAIQNDVCYEPELDYFEYLELLARSAAYLLPGKLRSSAGSIEAQAFGVPVITSEVFDNNLSELLLVSLKNQSNKQLDSSRIQAWIEENWNEVSKRTLKLWSQHF